MNRRILITIAVMLVAAGLWWLLKRPASADSAPVPPTAHVTVATLTTAPIVQTLEAFGVVGPATGTEQVSAAPYDCVISAVRTEAGGHVAAGDVLLEITPSPDATLLFESARTAQVVAEKALRATQERFDLKLATDQDLNVARQADTDARVRLKSLEARGFASGGRIRADAEGVVSKLEVTRGSLVVQGTPLVTVTTASALEARLAVEANTRSQLAKNQVVTLSSVESAEAATVESRVRSVGAAMNAADGSLEVRVPIPTGASLLLGEHVRALIQLRQQSAALVVARSAVLPEDGKQVLYTIKDGKAVRHEVTVGIAADDLLEVSAPDLRTGTPVVVVGNYELSDGMAVQIDTAPTEPAATPQTAPGP